MSLFWSFWLKRKTKHMALDGIQTYTKRTVNVRARLQLLLLCLYRDLIFSSDLIVEKDEPNLNPEGDSALRAVVRSTVESV